MALVDNDPNLRRIRVGAAAAGFGFARNQYNNLYNAYQNMRRNFRSGNTRSRFYNNIVGLQNARVAKRNAALKAARKKNYNSGTKAQKRVVGAGTNTDSQYVGAFAGNKLKKARGNDKYSIFGYRKNVETHGFASEDGNKPVRIVAQACNPPEIFYSVAVAFWRHLMKKYYNHEYQNESDVFQHNTVLLYEMPYQVRFIGIQRTGQNAAVGPITTTYTPLPASTLRDASNWLVANVLTFPGYGFGHDSATNGYLASIAILDNINNTPVTRKTFNLDKFFKVKYWSKLSCRIQNVTPGVPTDENPYYDEKSTDYVGVVPLHGNIIYSKGHTPRVKVDNQPFGSLVPFTWEDIPNGVILPKTAMIDEWYRTVQDPRQFTGVEKGYNVNLGAGQIKDFTLFFAKTCSLADFILKFGKGLNSDLTGTSSYGAYGFNRNATIQLEPYLGYSTVAAPSTTRVRYHCEWEIGAIVNSRQIAVMPKGYSEYQEDELA